MQFKIKSIHTALKTFQSSESTLDSRVDATDGVDFPDGFSSETFGGLIEATAAAAGVNAKAPILLCGVSSNTSGGGTGEAKMGPGVGSGFGA